MMRHDEEYYRQRKPLPDLGPAKNFKRFVWNSKRKAFLDRTASEWADVGIFYLCFYSVLFSIFALQMWITYKYVTAFHHPIMNISATPRSELDARNKLAARNRPILRQSTLRGPGIDLKPVLVSNSRQALVLIDDSNPQTETKKYVAAIDDILKEYTVDKTHYETTCSDKVLRDEYANTSCYFDRRSLGICAQSPYGYSNPLQPCVYIKFNKMIGWIPVFYSQGSQLPQDMPKWLQKVIQESEKFLVWLSCEGISEQDRQWIGHVEYLPAPGFPVQYFPYNAMNDYLAPIVALRFTNLTEDKTVNVECKTWARNIDNGNRYHLDFQIKIKNPTLS